MSTATRSLFNPRVFDIRKANVLQNISTDDIYRAVAKHMQKYEEIQTLLNLDGQKFWPNPKYWVKFEVRRVEATPQIPHGIKYSLTLHDQNNTRILGFDNAHLIKTKKRKRKKYTGRVVAWDHMHKLEAVKPYEFESASRLLDDFWNAVDEIVLGK